MNCDKRVSYLLFHFITRISFPLLHSPKFTDICDFFYTCQLRVFENRVLRRIFGPKRDEVTGEWRRLHNKELYGKYHSGNQIKKPEVGGACSTYGAE
jgi:hypothetical protein